MTRPSTLIGWLLCGLLAAPAPAPAADANADPGTPALAPAPGGIVLRRCTLEYERASSVGTALPGILQECLVRPGDRVKAGQVLGRLQDQEARAELELRTAEAESDVGIRLGQARFDQATARLKASSALRQRSFNSEEQYQQDRLEAQVAALSTEEAQERRRVAQIQRHVAEVAVQLREIVSPHAGVVVAVFKNPGESVNLGENARGLSIFRVVDVDRVLVTGWLDVVDAWRVRPGQPVRVWAEIGGADLPIEREEFLGRVTFVDVEVNPGDQTCKVVAAVENRDGMLRAGLEARMEIRQVDLDAAPSSEPGAAPDAAGGVGPRAESRPERVREAGR
ncbi:MAG TPA: HlyD family efflux transporter periplasmic adaptor subunit [Isosphaeraceae bacterium]